MVNADGILLAVGKDDYLCGEHGLTRKAADYQRAVVFRSADDPDEVSQHLGAVPMPR